MNKVLSLLFVFVCFAVAQDNGQDRLRNIMTTKGDSITTTGHAPTLMPRCLTGESWVKDTSTTTGWLCASTGAGSMVYPGAGFALSTGSAWNTSIGLDTDGTLAANSDAKLASQKAVKTYVDGHVGAGTMAVQNAGTPVGTRATLNLLAGSGVTLAGTDTGTAINQQISPDLAVMATHTSIQAGTAIKCVGASSAGVHYTCALTPTLPAYTTGMTILFIADKTAGTTPDLDVDALGVKLLKKADGTTAATSADVIAGQAYRLWFDGTVLRLPAAGSGTTTPTITKGVIFPYGPPTYGGFAPNAGVALWSRVSVFQLHEPVEMDSFLAAVNATSGTCGGTCGLVVQYRPLDLSSVYCAAEIAVSGGATNKDINTAGPLKLGFASGSNVTTGKCLLDAGFYALLSTSDSTTITMSGSGATPGVDTGAAGAAAGLISPLFNGYISSTYTGITGSGASIVVPADLSTAAGNAVASTAGFMWFGLGRN